MKNFSIWLLGIISLMTPSSVWGQWESVNSPKGGYVRSILFDGENMYAATGGGVLVSEDEGTSWEFRNSGLVSRDTKSLTQTDNYVFVSTDENVFRTNDGGISWESAGTDLEGIYTKHLLEIDGTLIAATYLRGLFRSFDDGDTWEPINNGFTGTNPYYLATDGATLFVGTYLDGLFRSSDLGTTWEPVNNGLPEMDIMAIICYEGKVFVATLSSGVYVSATNGDQWEPVPASLPSVKGFTSHNGVLYANANGGGVFRSDDLGVTWTSFNQGLTDTGLWAIGNSGAHLFVGSRDGFVYKRNFSSGEWMNSSQIEFNAIVGSLKSNESNLLAATHGSGFYLSNNDGDTWSRNSTIWTVENRALFVSDSDVLVGTDLLGVFKSTDNGATFSMSNNGLDSGWIQSFTYSQGYLFAGSGDQGVYRSDTMGTSWIAVNTGMEESNIVAMASDEQWVYAVSPENVYRSEDWGVSWNQVTNGLPNDFLTAITVSNGAVWVGTKNNGVYLSTDFGETWSQATEGMPSSVEVRTMLTHEDFLFLGTGYGQIFYRMGGGTQWFQIGEELSEGPILSLWVESNYLYATTHEGAIRKHPLDTILGGEDFTVSGGFKTYPNPASNNLFIHTKLERELRNMSLFDMMGRKVFTSDTPRIQYNISSLVPGIYVLQLVTNHGTFDMKIIKE